MPGVNRRAANDVADAGATAAKTLLEFYCLLAATAAYICQSDAAIRVRVAVVVRKCGYAGKNNKQK